MEIENLEIKGNTYQESGDVTDEEENVIGTMPSIDYHSEIECVTGINEISVSTKNLIKFAKEDWIGSYFNTDGTVNSWGGIKEGLIDSRYYMVLNGFSDIVLSFMPRKDLKVSRGGIAFYDKDKNPISSIRININENTLYSKGIRGSVKTKLDIPNGAVYFRFCLKWVRNPDNENINMYEEFYDYMSELQLEVGTEATEYVPYGGENYPISLKGIELNKIENYEDCIYKNNKKWYLYKAIKKVVLDGSESGWTLSRSPEQGYDYYRFRMDSLNSLGGKIKFSMDEKVVCSNCFKGLTQRQSDGNPMLICDYGIAGVNATGLFFTVPVDDKWTTLDLFKNFISEIQPVVYYVLENPVVTEITDEELIEQLESLNNLKTYKKITYIDSVADELKPALSLKYKQDLETIRENDKKEMQKMNARIDEIEALLSTTATSAVLLDNLENDLKSEVM